MDSGLDSGRQSSFTIQRGLVDLLWNCGFGINNNYFVTKFCLISLWLTGRLRCDDQSSSYEFSQLEFRYQTLHPRRNPTCGNHRHRIGISYHRPINCQDTLPFSPSSSFQNTTHFRAGQRSNTPNQLLRMSIRPLYNHTISSWNSRPSVHTYVANSRGL